ncbi:MAG: glycosyltransferase family 2 protein [Pseudomonadota bacterium]
MDPQMLQMRSGSSRLRFMRGTTNLLQANRAIQQNMTTLCEYGLRSTGNDQYFIYDLSDKSTIGLKRIELEVEYVTGHGVPKLYIPVHGQFSEASAYSFNKIGPNKYDFYFFAIKHINQIRIDYTDRELEFKIHSATCKSVSFVDTLKYFSDYYRSNSTGKKRKLGATRHNLRSLRSKSFAPDLRNYRFGTDLGNTYHDWIDIHNKPADPASYASEMERLKRKPLFSILVPTYNVDVKYFRELISSLDGQIYQRFEVCIADDCSTNKALKAYLIELAQSSDRYKVVIRRKNGNISAASNDALKMCSGDFVVLADHDDMMHPLALLEVVRAINKNPDAKILFSDEDKIDENNIRSDPYFKTEWDKNLFYCHNSMTHLIVYRREDIEAVGGFRSEFDGSQDYDLALRIIEQVDEQDIIHIPNVLYHWRMITGSVALGGAEKNYAHDRARQAIQQHFDRIGLDARSVAGPNQYVHSVEYGVDDTALVSIVICTRDRSDLLKTCIDSIVEKTDYSNFEILIVDNGSVEPKTLAYFDRIKKENIARIVHDDSDFNYSKLNNLGVSESKGEIICLLNNDIEVISSNWLEQLVAHVQRPEVGAVGAKLLYPDGSIQHAGVVVGMGGYAAHPYAGLPSDTLVNNGKAQLTQQVSAVTGACLVTTRSVYEQVDGLDEVNFAIAYNDVDYCLKVRKLGMQVIYEPRAILYHHESVSRGSDVAPEKIKRFEREKAALKERWPNEIRTVPFFSPNYDRGSAHFTVEK